MTHALQLTLTWHGDVVDVRRIGDQDDITIGVGPDDDLFAPLPGDATRKGFAIAARLDDGAWIIRATPAMSMRVEDGVGRLVEGAAFDGEAFTAPLHEGGTARIDLGAFTVELSTRPRLRAPVAARAFDALFANVVVVTSACMLAIVAAAALIPRAPRLDLNRISFAATAYRAVVERITPPSVRVRLRAPQPTTSSTQRARLPRAAAGPETMAAPARPGLDVQRLRDAAVVDGKLAQLFDGDGLSAIGRGQAGALSAGLAAMRGPSISAGGHVDLGGLAVRGGIPAASETYAIGRIEVGDAVPDALCDACAGSIGLHVDRPVDVVAAPAPPPPAATVNREAVRRVVQSHSGQVRACYERALQTHPGAQGKLVVAWTIDGRGRAVAAAATEDHVGVAGLDDCIVAAVRTWRFPVPKGAGTALVNYPFVLRRGG